MGTTRRIIPITPAESWDLQQAKDWIARHQHLPQLSLIAYPNGFRVMARYLPGTALVRRESEGEEMGSLKGPAHPLHHPLPLRGAGALPQETSTWEGEGEETR